MARPASARCAVEDFCTGPGKTVLAPDELVTAIRSRRRRRAPARSTSSTAAASADGAGHGRRRGARSRSTATAPWKTCASCWRAVAPTPLRACQAEAVLRGRRLDAGAIGRGRAGGDGRGAPDRRRARQRRLPARDGGRADPPRPATGPGGRRDEAADRSRSPSTASRASSSVDALPQPARRAAQRGRPHRHQEGLRRRRMRLVHRPARRQAGERLPGARRAKPSGSEIVTIEGMQPRPTQLASAAGELHEVRRARSAASARRASSSLAKALLDENPDPTRTRSASRSPATSAAAPATPRSSTRSRWPRAKRRGRRSTRGWRAMKQRRPRPSSAPASSAPTCSPRSPATRSTSADMSCRACCTARRKRSDDRARAHQAHRHQQGAGAARRQGGADARERAARAARTARRIRARPR